jgi:thiamine kinase-like enzyme
MEDVRDTLPAYILAAFGLQANSHVITPIGNGHIHITFKLTGEPSFVLQRVNKDVFKQPEIIASNLRVASAHLSKYHPHYNFLRCIPGMAGEEMVYDRSGYPWRLFPFIGNTCTLDRVVDAADAYSAAVEFGRLTRYLNTVDVTRFQETIPRFHDLSLRYEQFETSLRFAITDRKKECAEMIATCQGLFGLVEEYKQLAGSGYWKLRITHNDTKINNVLFDEKTRKTVCVIDLDTLMPGYFAYDLGDMVRTFVPPVSEEEGDVTKIVFRKEIYDALLAGYLSEMKDVMSPQELETIPWAGKIMTYMMALRFLTDYLRGDVYYHITYPDQNRVRAGNQLRLLEVLQQIH